MSVSVAELGKQLGKQWPAIEKAKAETAAQLAKLKKLVVDVAIDSEDVSVVVFGSLARQEWTAGSDLDWTILIDGQAEHQHAITAHRLNDLLEKAEFRKPGATRTFGNLAFSHNLIHEIGGQDDSNRNTTRRLLLLLESRPVNRQEAYDRVVKAVLHRYLQNDFRKFRLKVPRFLLNDLHRFWRTMCVDYASKYWEQAGEKWAIRNVKLRFSRKLIFASGLIACFSCDEDWIKERLPALSQNPDPAGLVEYLLPFVDQTPLDILADTVATEAPRAASLLFDSYDTFLQLLDQDQVRKHLEQLKPSDAANDNDFRSMQDLADQFETGLEQLFFQDSQRLSLLIRKYGVF